ncbi:hypothetical protein HPSA_04570 [Helicobacter pylori SouthAfrica7]|uniref:Uncharacterized protein n=1 Tax=Helicobacter pylori (strain SouthAfrica7) TaxID=907239 RepID=E8QSD4_HELPW|nr:hypothetical protein HPSA_04570 [Helicobacter pylori SouthAfrica7]
MSAKCHEFSSYYKVLYIFYPHLEILKRVLLGMGFFLKWGVDHKIKKCFLVFFTF